MDHRLQRCFAIFFIAISALWTRAEAQNDAKIRPASPSAATAACLTEKELSARHIYGDWQVRFGIAPAGLPAQALMRLEKHAEFSESLAGVLTRELVLPQAGGHAARAQLAGDLEDGYLTLDESSNGVSITGTWNGEMVKGSCGKIFTGTWKDTRDNAPPDSPDIPFTLEKLPRW
jgi:hypothetical protein